jgi:hypothetical protein
MDRRLFLRLSGMVAAAAAFNVPTVAAQSGTNEDVTLHAPGAYQITGRVRLEESLVAITGISNAQQISWAAAGRAPVTTFTTFESFDTPWRAPDIMVQGGRLEALSIVPLEAA